MKLFCFRKRTISITLSEDEALNIQALKVTSAKRESRDVPGIVTVSCYTVLERVTISCFRAFQTDAVMNNQRMTIIVGETVVTVIVIRCAVDDFHCTGIVVLVEALSAMPHRQTTVKLRIVLGTITT